MNHTGLPEKCVTAISGHLNNAYCIHHVAGVLKPFAKVTDNFYKFLFKFSD